MGHCSPPAGKTARREQRFRSVNEPPRNRRRRLVARVALIVGAGGIVLGDRSGVARVLRLLARVVCSRIPIGRSIGPARANGAPLWRS